MSLSKQARAVWAKSRNDDEQWLPLHVHLDDAAAVTGYLWNHWLAPRVRSRIAADMGRNESDVRRLAMFLAGVHDIGKATPIFSCDDSELLALAADAGLDPTTDKALRPTYRHEVTGMVALQDWLIARGLPRDVAGTWSAVVGGHHGAPPSAAKIAYARKDLKRLGGPIAFGRGTGWASVRDELMSAHWSSSGMDQSDLRAPLDQASQVVLTGLVIVADWIASNEDFFGYTGTDSPTRLPDAMDKVALPAPWSPDAPDSAAQLFTDRFGAAYEPRPVQRAILDVVEQMNEPGLVVVEAPMGEGKTEAALMAAEALAAKFGCGGIHVALPTQSTTDGMFSRVLDWTQRLPANTLQLGANIHLGHGKSKLNQTYRGLPRGGAREVGEEDARVSVHPWMTGRKKSLLAPFCITTIDQLLMTALRRKHLAMQHLALAGKVVVIDEVHAYDTWMSVYLDRVLEWLGAYQVPVILLSATLPSSRRAELLSAYSGRPAQPTGTEPRYPAITWSGPHSSGELFPTSSGRSSTVRIEHCDEKRIVPLATAAAAAGACVLVIRNSVASAIRTRDAVAGQTDRVSLHHSRFISVDRATGDAELLRKFGRDGDRPGGWVAVTTQVAEQSLDVDFDLLITDIAPVDLVLQRIGRLHRHERERPAGFETPRCVIAGVEYRDSSPGLPDVTMKIYGQWPILRAAAVLDGVETVRVPDDIAPLVHTAYEDDAAPGSWAAAMELAQSELDEKIERQRYGAGQFRIAPPADEPLYGWIDGSQDADDETAQAQVRDLERSLEVMVLQRRRDGVLTIPEWIDHPLAGVELPADRVPSRSVCESMMSCTVRISKFMTNLDALEPRLREDTPAAWRGDDRRFSPIADLPVLAVHENGYASVGLRDTLRYDRHTGLIVERNRDA